LTGYRLGQPATTAGGDLDLTLYWKATHTEPVSKGYKVFVHLLNEEGQVIAQHDGEPAGGRRPTHTWKSGDTIVDTHRLTWNAADYRGTATLVTGLYDFETGERLPAFGARGERLLHDSAFLGEVVVE
jgi:hypothetical protein